MLLNTYVKLQNFFKDERGVTAIEYAIIGVAVSAIVLAVFAGDANSLKTALSGAVNTITTNITSANTIKP
ncbi:MULTISPECIES: Flp family type IVb pilin [Bacteria]|uniref:Flp family type IVb pilin n=1 Tax=Photobacterium damselae subsp. damselae TaxID=85581 RepID=A0AAD3WUU4_PHODD|nr:Flp family type IVb pilin [Photobacterium damselae]PLS40677.1 Flp family type IVb pilin [Carnobacterium maltaromaticum]KAB1180249.1 Flp family type IVb pilin [Photobacterium damselae subsp. damselae]NVO73639.1 Flp family type IVb pilin [Photobacterium damselae subsp. damselae]PSB90611.1 Flp family type IVb pilin [Photobacterium damselae subsp. damselae]UKA31801.1 Flp family type IVb pilin [Photobacterium damselae subsp. damselae]